MAHRSISKLLKSYHLRPVKAMKFSFDPYAGNVDVKSDRSDPVMDVTFADGHKLLMKTANLSTLEILDRLWRFCDAKDPKKDEAPGLKTKATKKDAKEQ
nr:hypothetical protein BaRGS_030644 [Batillaria attramentaria]